MLTVLVCGVINSGMLLGLGAGIAVGLIRARGAIAAALTYDVLDPAVVIPTMVRPVSA